MLTNQRSNHLKKESNVDGKSMKLREMSVAVTCCNWKNRCCYKSPQPSEKKEVAKEAEKFGNTREQTGKSRLDSSRVGMEKEKKKEQRVVEEETR